MEKAKIIFSKKSGFNYRIPSIVNAGGVLVAAADGGKSGLDWGYIEIRVRRSLDGGESWSAPKTIAAPPARSKSAAADNTKSAFFIDPCMAVAPNGDILMLLTFFPESKGAHNLKFLDGNKAAYAQFDGNDRPIVYDRDRNYYIIAENGDVLDKNKNKTEYKIKGFGGLYKGEEYKGNIYLNGVKGSDDEEEKTTFGAPLKAPKRSYIYLLRSTDRGESWSGPQDITPQILNEEDGVFLGVAPGTGLTTQLGRILFPLYTPKGTVCIYSDDNGATFKRNQDDPYTKNKGEWTMIESPSGRIYGYGRDKGKIPATISFDQGITWARGDRPPFPAPACQKNALALGNKVFLSHPDGNERKNGIISLGEFEYDKKGNFKGIFWTDEMIEINHAFFAYSCLVKIDDETLGLIYENKPFGEIAFLKINL